MKTLLSLVVHLIFMCSARADSGGPYQGVPDLKPDETPPVFRIPDDKNLLSFYLGHIPKVTVNKELNEPDSYTWEPITGHHACFRRLGHVGGHLILELRYISNERIAQGLDYADILVILAKGFDATPDGNLCRPIYFASDGADSGAIYDHTADYLPDGDKYGAVVVTAHYDGNGCMRDLVGIRGTEEYGFERFEPSIKAEEESDPDETTTESEAEPEGGE